MKKKIKPIQEKITFKPNYEYWWNKKNLTADDLSILIFGINPYAFRALQELDENKNKAFKPQESFTSFAKFIKDNIPQYSDYYRICELRNDLLNRGYWTKTKGNKLTFIKKVYEDGFGTLNKLYEIHPAFQGFLKKKDKSLFPHDHYKKWDEYIFDFKTNIEKITEVESASAALLGLNLKYIKKFNEIYKVWDNKSEHYFNKLTGEERLFTRQYRLFLYEYFQLDFPEKWLLEFYKSFCKYEFKNKDFEKFANLIFNQGYKMSNSIIIKKYC